MDEIKELQTLTTTKGVYNSFPDLTARKDLKAKLNAPGNVKAGDYLRVKSVGEDGTVVVEGAEGPGTGSGQNGTTPHIGADGNWWIGDTDTGVRAQGPQGPAYELTDDDRNGIAAEVLEALPKWTGGAY